MVIISSFDTHNEAALNYFWEEFVWFKSDFTTRNQFPLIAAQRRAFKVMKSNVALHSMKRISAVKEEKKALALNETFCIIFLCLQQRHEEMEFSPFFYVMEFGKKTFHMVRASPVEFQSQLYL